MHPPPVLSNVPVRLVLVEEPGFLSALPSCTDHFSPLMPLSTTKTALLPLQPPFFLPSRLLPPEKRQTELPSREYLHYGDPRGSPHLDTDTFPQLLLSSLTGFPFPFPEMPDLN